VTVSLRLRAGTAAEAAAVFNDAFVRYPVMTYVVGEEGPYAERLGILMHLFAMEAELFGDPIRVLEDAGRAVACATIGRPGRPSESPEFDALAERTWEQLGPEAESRYRTYSAAAHAVHSPRPGMYLDMLGVVGSHQGRGLARDLLLDVQEISCRDPLSEGVLLTTENPANVPFYERFGYEVIAHAQVAEGMETWGFFRADDVGDPEG